MAGLAWLVMACIHVACTHASPFPPGFAWLTPSWKSRWDGPATAGLGSRPSISVPCAATPCSSAAPPPPSVMHLSRPPPLPRPPAKGTGGERSGGAAAPVPAAADADPGGESSEEEDESSIESSSRYAEPKASPGWGGGAGGWVGKGGLTVVGCGGVHLRRLRGGVCCLCPARLCLPVRTALLARGGRHGRMRPPGATGRPRLIGAGTLQWAVWHNHNNTVSHAAPWCVWLYSACDGRNATILSPASPACMPHRCCRATGLGWLTCG